MAVEVAPGRGRLGLTMARVVEKLGSLNSESAVSLIAINAHGIPNVFPAPALREAEAATAAGLRGREDWRDVAFVTIDPPDAKDHDDAVHALPDPDPKNPGGHVISIAIADVAHYVQPGSALDREALIRGNSVYFPDRVVPMLPERISNDLCSLRPNEDRAALAVRIVVAADGRKRAHSFHRVLMRSAARLSYMQAQEAIGGRTDEDTQWLVAPVLTPLYAAYQALKRARDERGPLDLDLPERKIVLKADGTVDRVVTPARLEAHRLIEEFMILANVAAAEALERASVPLIYRVHDEPDPERVNALREFLKTVDISLPKGNELKAAQFNHILERVKGRDVEKLVNEVVLRTQAQAEYSAENYGHYRAEPAPLRPFHLADPPLCGSGGAPRLDPRRQARRRRSRRERGRAGAGRGRRHHLGRRAARHEGGARDLRPPARAFPGRSGRRHLRGPHLRGDPRRPVRQARRYRRRRLHSGAHHRQRVFRLSRGSPCADRQLERRELSAGRPGHGEAGRGGSARRRAAVRAPLGGPARQGRAARQARRPDPPPDDASRPQARHKGKRRR